MVAGQWYYGQLGWPPRSGGRDSKHRRGILTLTVQRMMYWFCSKV